MDKTHFFNLINAANINSGLLSENFARSHEDFLNFPVNLKGLPILIAADPSVFEFSSDDVFQLSEKEIQTKVYNLVDRKYVGYQHAFPTNKFLRQFTVKKSVKKFVDEGKNFSVDEE